MSNIQIAIQNSFQLTYNEFNYRYNPTRQLWVPPTTTMKTLKSKIIADITTDLKNELIITKTELANSLTFRVMGQEVSDTTKIKNVCQFTGQCIQISVNFETTQAYVVKYGTSFFVVLANEQLAYIKKRLKKLEINVRGFENHELTDKINGHMTLTESMIVPTTVGESVHLHGSIYLLREREFVNTNTPVYKIGMTQQEPNKRLNKYPKNSELVIVMGVPINKTVQIEKHLIREFKKEFNHRHDIGAEYFEGDVQNMMRKIFTFIMGSF